MLCVRFMKTYTQALLILFLSPLLLLPHSLLVVIKTLILFSSPSLNLFIFFCYQHKISNFYKIFSNCSEKIFLFKLAMNEITFKPKTFKTLYSFSLFLSFLKHNKFFFILFIFDAKRDFFRRLSTYEWIVSLEMFPNTHILRERENRVFRREKRIMF